MLTFLQKYKRNLLYFRLFLFKFNKNKTMLHPKSIKQLIYLIYNSHNFHYSKLYNHIIFFNIILNNKKIYLFYKNLYNLKNFKKQNFKIYYNKKLFKNIGLCKYSIKKNLLNNFNLKKQNYKLLWRHKKLLNLRKYLNFNIRIIEYKYKRQYILILTTNFLIKYYKRFKKIKKFHYKKPYLSKRKIRRYLFNSLYTKKERRLRRKRGYYKKRLYYAKKLKFYNSKYLHIIKKIKLKLQTTTKIISSSKLIKQFIDKNSMEDLPLSFIISIKCLFEEKIKYKKFLKLILTNSIFTIEVYNNYLFKKQNLLFISTFGFLRHIKIWKTIHKKKYRGDLLQQVQNNKKFLFKLLTKQYKKIYKQRVIKKVHYYIYSLQKQQLQYLLPAMEMLFYLSNNKLPIFDINRYEFLNNHKLNKYLWSTTTITYNFADAVYKYIPLLIHFYIVNLLSNPYFFCNNNINFPAYLNILNNVQFIIFFKNNNTRYRFFRKTNFKIFH